jgi:FixJ family two-component response regulator
MAELLGATTVVEKPVTAQSLSAAIRNALDYDAEADGAGGPADR